MAIYVYVACQFSLFTSFNRAPHVWSAGNATSPVWNPCQLRFGYTSKLSLGLFWYLWHSIAGIDLPWYCVLLSVDGYWGLYHDAAGYGYLKVLVPWCLAAHLLRPQRLWLFQSEVSLPTCYWLKIHVIRRNSIFCTHHPLLSEGGTHLQKISHFVYATRYQGKTMQVVRRWFQIICATCDA